MPTFDDGFEVTLVHEFGDTFANTGSQTFSDGFVLELYNLFGDTFANSGSQTFSDGFQSDLYNLFGETIFNLAAGPLITPVFSAGFELVLDTRYEAGDTGFEILISPFVIPPFPGNMSMVEIIYPVVPISESNIVLTRLDNEEIRATVKGVGVVVKEVDTMRFRVSTDYLAAFLANLDTNRAAQFRLATPGYTPFGGASEDNYVRVLGRSRPQREDRGLTQLVDVTFRFMAVYP